MKKEKIKFISCDEDSQIFNYQRTYKKAAAIPEHIKKMKKKIKNKYKR